MEDSGGEVLIRASLFHDDPGWARLLLLPAVLLKQACDQAFHWIADRLAGELLGREQRSGAEHVTAFLAVSAASCVAYWGREHMDVALLALILGWRIDELLAWGEFAGGGNHREVTLSAARDGRLEWRLAGSPPTRLAPGQASRVCLRRLQLRTGWLRRGVATAWRVSLRDDSGGDLPVYEHAAASEALAEARKLARRLAVPVKVSESQGTSELAEGPTRLEPAGEESLQSSESEGALRLSAGWTRGSLGVYLGQAAQESGLLLFLICVTRLLTAFGALLSGLVLPWFAYYLGLKEQVLLIINLADFQPLLDPVSSPLDLAELVLAVAVLAHALWWLGRSKHLLVGADRTRFFIGEELMASLATERLEPPLFLASPEPLILLTDGTSVIEVADLPTPAAYRDLMHRLESRGRA